MKIFHISDLHITGEAGGDLSVCHHLERLAAQVERGDLVVVTGDITSDGLAYQYKRAAELLRPFDNRILLAPGNHDYGVGGIAYSHACEMRFLELCTTLGCCSFTRTFSVDGRRTGEVIVLDSCLHTGSPLDFFAGRVGAWNRWWLRRRLERIRKEGAISVVALHHSPYCQEWFLRLQDARPFMQTVLGRADYVLFGHEHRARRTWFPNDIPGAKAQTNLFGADALHKKSTTITVILMPSGKE